MFEYVKEGRVAIFTINNGVGTNAMTLQGIKEYSDAMRDFRDDPDLWAGIITGSGRRVFCSGGDLREMMPTLKNQGSAADSPPTPQREMRLYKPLIAAINGLAFGGGLEIALACDIRIAAPHARFGLPETAVGLIPGWGGTQRLPRTIPYCKAAAMILAGKTLDAREACDVGLINEVVPLENLMSSAREYAACICRLSPSAVRAAKEAMLRGLGRPLEDGLELENELVTMVLNTADFNEGITAYLEKRPPVFKGE